MDYSQRNFKRIPSKILAKCRSLHTQERYRSASLLNFHHVGCCLSGDINYEVGHHLMVVMELPLVDSLYLRSEVLWTKEFRIYKNGQLTKGVNIGVRFLLDDPVTKDACDQVYKYCEVRQTRDYSG